LIHFLSVIAQPRSEAKQGLRASRNRDGDILLIDEHRNPRLRVRSAQIEAVEDEDLELARSIADDLVGDGQSRDWTALNPEMIPRLLMTEVLWHCTGHLMAFVRILRRAVSLKTSMWARSASLPAESIKTSAGPETPYDGLAY